MPILEYRAADTVGERAFLLWWIVVLQSLESPRPSWLRYMLDLSSNTALVRKSAHTSDIAQKIDQLRAGHQRFYALPLGTTCPEYAISL